VFRVLLFKNPALYSPQMQNVHFGNIETLLPIALGTQQYSKLVILADENTAELCFPKVEPHLPTHQLLTMPAGEAHKTIDTVSSLWEQLIAIGADRKTLIINLGGGVVTDLGGFFAGTYKRGIRFINIPTSLLAMVDASVGSKTGIDFAGVKNSIGLFQDAEAVLIDPMFLKTLPDRQRINGYAEIIKHGLIADADHWKQWAVFEPNNDPSWNQMIKRSVSVKAEVVRQDPTEKGKRKILNFGHTLGHAIEAWSLEHEKDHLLHGEAIALGMIAEAYLSHKHTGLPEEEFASIRAEITKHFATKSLPSSAFQQMLNSMKNDKKNEGGNVQYSLLESIGKSIYNVSISESDSLRALEYLNTL